MPAGVREQVTRALSPVAAVSQQPLDRLGSIAGPEDQGPRAGRLVHEVFTMGLEMFFSAQSRKTCARAADPSARADQIFVVGSDGLGRNYVQPNVQHRETSVCPTAWHSYNNLAGWRPLTALTTN
jgi:hypothetical protein